MYKLEVKLDGKFVNNFYNGSVYDIVFLALEFWLDYVKGKAVRRIYGYTITRILRSSKQQYIKIHFLESEIEEKTLVKQILKDFYRLKDKIFVGFNIKGSDLPTLKSRLKPMNIYSNPIEIQLFDLRDCVQYTQTKGLNGLFKSLGIEVKKKIDGSYFRRNPKRVFFRKQGWIEILLNMFEYCLEDAAGYFEIVSKWKIKCPVVTKDMIKSELLSYSIQEAESALN
ncbi:ribonuclease H-like domain-containing protein [Microseira wollei]|uniref:YprB ribonuclease H-like domain-containing protein n=1 Tax=Microseira wollei NIES-4236 TaxID=2530354 RepID=A0AAV3X1F7_9CYAN|nr:ribonuclease H-like domain-containing protein [Microseira wollei]GET35748.1 hypothetical protein MiSe_04930 [Microseira wollei NIES-4236]